VRHAGLVLGGRGRALEEDPGSVLPYGGASGSASHGRPGRVAVGSGGSVGTIGVGVAGAGVAVGGLVGATVGDGVFAGEAVGATVGAAVWTCAGVGVPGAGVGRAGPSVALFPVGPGAGEGEPDDGDGVSDGLPVAVAEGPPTASLTSLVAVNAASARPTPSAGPRTR
jgi:hypothetical protein